MQDRTTARFAYVRHVLLAASDGITAAVSATATLAGVFVGGALTSRGQTRRQRSAVIGAASQRYQDEYSEIFAGLTKANREGRTSSGEAVVPFSRYNQAMNGLLMVAPRSVADTVIDLDAAIGEVHSVVKRGGATETQWRHALDHTDAAQLRFLNAVRVAVGVSKEPLTQFYGKNQRATAKGS